MRKQIILNTGFSSWRLSKFGQVPVSDNAPKLGNYQQQVILEEISRSSALYKDGNRKVRPVKHQRPGTSQPCS